MKYVVMEGRFETVIVRSDDNKKIKAYIRKGYGIVNRIRSKRLLNDGVVTIVGGERCDS